MNVFIIGLIAAIAISMTVAISLLISDLYNKIEFIKATASIDRELLDKVRTRSFLHMMKINIISEVLSCAKFQNKWKAFVDNELEYLSQPNDMEGR